MPSAVPPKIDLNTAAARSLTQLPGISKTLAYSIVNHRQRHGFFTSWEELTEVKQFPVEKLDEIKNRATLTCPDSECNPPRRISSHHLERNRKKPAGFTRRMRATQRPKKAHDTGSHRPH
jgi:helix-hairpin-helix protein